MTDTQRAILYDRIGNPEVLYLAQVPVPVAGDGQVVVAIRAVGLNPWDYKVRTGVIPLTEPFPRSIGGDFSGIIAQVGENSRYHDGIPVAVGDEVLGWGFGSLREQFLVPATQIARKPPELDLPQAAVIGGPAKTALLSLEAVPVGAGDTVLVSAAAGAVGFVYSQLAIQAGARVIGTASPVNHARLRDIGVEAIVYGAGLADRVRRLAPDGITAVQDNVGGETIDAALALGVPRHRICEIVDHDATARLRLASPARTRSAATLQKIAERFAAGELTLPIGHRFPPDRVAEAFQVLESRHPRGKVVVVW